MHFTSADYDIDNLWDKLQDHVAEGMWQPTSEQNKIVQVVFLPLDGTTASVAKVAPSTDAWSGPQSNGDTVPQAAVIVKLRTDQRGRSGRGRVFLPWPWEGVIENGRFSSADRDACTAAWGAFVDDMRGDSVDLVVASYVHAYKNAVVSANAETFCGTQRRRQPRA